MSVRPEEEVCANALQEFLKNEHGISASWTGVEKDPPDLAFKLTKPDGSQESWAVEVTGMVQRYHQDGRDGGGNRYDFEYRLYVLVEKLNDELHDEMERGYVLVVHGPIDRQAYRALPDRIKEYVRSGRTGEEPLDLEEAWASVKQELGESFQKPGVRDLVESVALGRTRVTIRSIGKGRGICVLSGIDPFATVPDSAIPANNVVETLNYSLDYILSQKVPRMAGVDGYDRKVLLLWKAIPFVDALEIENALTTKELGDIQGVFVYEHGAERITMVLNKGIVNDE